MKDRAGHIFLRVKFSCGVCVWEVCMMHGEISESRAAARIRLRAGVSCRANRINKYIAGSSRCNCVLKCYKVPCPFHFRRLTWTPKTQISQVWARAPTPGHCRRFCTALGFICIYVLPSLIMILGSFHCHCNLTFVPLPHPISYYQWSSREKAHMWTMLEAF